MQDTENISGFLSVNLLESREREKNEIWKTIYPHLVFKNSGRDMPFDKVKIVMLNENANGMNLMKMHVLSVKSE